MSRTLLPLQAALVAALTGDTGIDDLIGGRVYDRPPTKPNFPYVTLGDMGSNDDGAECIVGEEVFVTMHIWSRDQGSVGAKTIAAAITRLLDQATLDLGDDAVLVDLAFRSLSVLDDPDGLTSHGVLTFTALTEDLPAST